MEEEDPYYPFVWLDLKGEWYGGKYYGIKALVVVLPLICLVYAELILHETLVMFT